MARSEMQRKSVLPGETEVGTDSSHQRGRDDVLTTGESFRQLSVISVFLGKAVCNKQLSLFL